MNIDAAHPRPLTKLFFITLLALLGTWTQVQAQVGTSWRLRSPKPWGDDLTGVVSTTDRIIAVGRGNAVLQSLDDGVTWTASQLDRTDDFFQENSIAWNGQSGAASKLVIGTGSDFWISGNGSVWAKANAGLSTDSQIKAVIWAGTHWAAIVVRQREYAVPTAELMSSPDGETWTTLGAVPKDEDEYFGSVRMVWTGSAYVVAVSTSHRLSSVNSGLLLHTPDGVTWTTRRLDGETEASDLLGLVWTGSKLVAVGNGLNGSHAYTSPTGLVWSEFDMVSYPNCLAWTGTQLVTTNYAGVETSVDGEEWITDAINLPYSLDVRALHWTGTQLVGVGGSGVIHTSGDALTWTQRTPTGPTRAWTSVARNPAGVLVAFDDAGNPWRSTDAESWAAATVVDGPIFSLIRDVVWDGSHFVGVGGDLLVTSPDGLEWTVESAFAGLSMEAVASAEGTLVVVGAGFAQEGMISTSTDAGATWTLQDVPGGSSTLRSVARIGTQWVAVGDAAGEDPDIRSTILVSTDAVTWSKRDPGNVAASLSGVAGTSSLMVAMGEDAGGTVLTSTDGTTWTVRPQMGYFPTQRVVWTGTNFLATGYAGLARTSVDGVTWTTRHTNTGQNLTDLIWTGTDAIAVGQGGLVISSDATPDVRFAASTTATSEGDGTLAVEVILSGQSPTALSIPITLSGTATSGADFTGAPATVDIAAGELTKTINLPLTDDATIEPNETVQLELGAVSGVRLGQPSTHNATILDNDGPPPVRFSKVSLTAPESAGSITARVQLGWPAPSAVSVPVAVSGTAGGTDFTGLPATVAFSQGESVKYVTFAITDDAAAESAETVVLTLGAPTGAVLGAGTVFTLTIEDNDTNTALGSRWTLRQPLPAAEGINGIATKGNRQAIVGNGGLALTSDDAGLTWTRRFTGSEMNYSRVIAHGPSGFLAVGDTGHVLTSGDGAAWFESVIPDAQNTEFYGAVTNGSKTLLCGYHYGPQPDDNRPVIYATRDLLTWKQVPIPASAQGQASAIAWSGTKFVLVGGEYDYESVGDDTDVEVIRPLILTSDDGQVWTDRSSAVTAEVYFENVIWAGDKFIAFAASNKVYTSPDGVSWTERNGGAKTLYAGVSTTGNQVLAVGEVIGASTNGTTWTQRASGTTAYLYDVVKTATNFIAIGGNNTILTSPDGVAWTARSSTLDRYSGLNAVAWSGTQFVAVGGDASPNDNADAAIVLTSPDGVAWTQRTVAAKGGLNGVAWSGSLFVAVGTDGQIFTSANGIAWAARTSGVKLELRDVIWTGSQFVAVGGSHTAEEGGTGPGGSVVLTSPNGTAWTRRTIPTAYPLLAVCFDGSRYVAVGSVQSGAEFAVDEAVVLTSTDAINWTEGHSGVFNLDLTDVATNGSGFVAVSRSFDVIRSTDGISWQPAASVPPPAFSNYLPALHGVCWAGDRYVAVGTRGALLTSVDGDTWSRGHTATPALTGYDVAWNGAMLVAVGENASIQTSGSGAVPAPVVAFQSATSVVPESVGTVGMVVKLSSPPTAKVTVPLTLMPGTALVLSGASADVTPPAPSVVFNPGETTKVINVEVKDDKLDEADETLSILLGAPAGGSATLGATTIHQITIEDDDVAPAIEVDGQPVHQFVLQGAHLELVVTATGSEPLTYQWKKNNVNISGATSRAFFVPAATLADAGAYVCTVSNGTLPAAVSATAQVVVYEKVTKRQVNAPTKDVVLTQVVAGNNLDIKWYKDNSPTELSAAPPHILYDATKKILTIKQPIAGADAGSYQCQILQTDSSLLYNGSRYEVDTATAKPLLPNPITLPTGRVGVLYSQAVVAAGESPAVAMWTATGLPGGLTINGFTGEIRGYPTAAVTNKAVTITAVNGLGTTVSTAKITIDPLPAGVAGVWYGLVGRDPYFNNNLGSRLELSVSSAGIYTGRFTTGTVTQPIVGQCGVTGTLTDATTQVLLPGNLKATLTFGFDTAAATPALVASLTVRPVGNPVASVIEFTGWHKHAAPASYKGRYNFGLDLYVNEQGDPAIPQGTSYGYADVTVAGGVTTNVRLSDGTSAFSTGFLGTSGEFIIYAPLYANKGSFIAQPTITLRGGAPGFLTSFIDDPDETTSWSKPKDTTPAGARKYRNGWAPIPLYLSGQRYVAPLATQVVMGMSYVTGGFNARLSFSGAGVESLNPSLSLNVNIKKPTGALDPLPLNPYKMTFVSIPSTGSFKGMMNGTQSLNGTVVTRNVVPFEGLIIPGRTTAPLPDQGVGFFLLPQLPDVNISPLPNPNTTPILSGKVELTPLQPAAP